MAPAAKRSRPIFKINSDAKVDGDLTIELPDGREVSVLGLLKRIEYLESALADYIILGDHDDNG